MYKALLLPALAMFIAGGILLLVYFTLISVPEVPQQVLKPNATITQENGDVPALSMYVRNRKVIWAMDFLPDGRMLFTERGGIVSARELDGEVKEILNVNVHTSGESGLHGIAVDPNFVENGFVYLYYTYRDEEARAFNRVSRYSFENNALYDESIIVDRIPGAPTHDGGRLKFGPDSFLYITTGDAQAPTLSQDRDSLAGKILRVTRSGEPAPGNPFGSRVYSYGHRNPQGITWDDSGRLWATEHGPTAQDELNLIETGANYGWPEITGTETRAGMHTPVVQSGQSTWAPSGAEYYNNSILFVGLRGGALYKYDIIENELTVHLKNSYGRLRDVILGPDGFLYIATSNHDGRGTPTYEDDRIIRVDPLKLEEI